jgi:hypothetical protein
LRASALGVHHSFIPVRLECTVEIKYVIGAALVVVVLVKIFSHFYYENMEHDEKFERARRQKP